MAMVNGDSAPDSRVRQRNSLTRASTFAETNLWKFDITLAFRRQPTYFESESLFVGVGTQAFAPVLIPWSRLNFDALIWRSRPTLPSGPKCTVRTSPTAREQRSSSYTKSYRLAILNRV